MDQIASRHGWMRDLFPIYSFRQLIWNIIIIAAIFAILFKLDENFALFGTLSGMFGALIVQFRTRPAIMIVPEGRLGAIEDILRRSKWVHKVNENRWTVPMPPWLRWDHSTVSFCQLEKNIEVRAPASILKRFKSERLAKV